MDKIQIEWKKSVDDNGATMEEVIQVVIDRLEAYQAGPFKCRENALAITKLQEAKMWLEHRMTLRREQGIEGKDIPHESHILYKENS